MRATQETGFLRVKHGKPYLVTRTKFGKTRKEQWTPLEGIDRKVLEAALQVKHEVQDHIVDYPCSNPRCKNVVKMTKKQLEEFFVSSKKRYDMMIFPFCSTTCRDEMLAQHGGDIPHDPDP